MCCCMHVVAITDVKQWQTICEVIWQTVHEHVAANVFHSKKTSSMLLIHEEQAPQT